MANIIKDNPTSTTHEYDVVEQMEKEWPEMTTEFKRIQAEQYRLFLHKQHDYGPGNISVGTQLQTPDEIKLSLTGLWFRMNDKLQRLKTLLLSGRENAVEEEFFQDGNNIIDEFLKRKNSYFPKKNTEMLGIEVGLNYNLPNNLNFVGYMDVVLHNKVTGRVKIIDIKTATMGWNKYMKADKNKTNQLLLYKQFFSKEREIPIDKIDIEYLILKRKLYENIAYPQKRIQVFSPASGKPSINRVITRLQEFMEECYDEDGNIIDNDYQKCEKHKKCRLCKDL